METTVASNSLLKEQWPMTPYLPSASLLPDSSVK